MKSAVEIVNIGNCFLNMINLHAVGELEVFVGVTNVRISIQQAKQAIVRNLNGGIYEHTGTD